MDYMATDYSTKEYFINELNEPNDSKWATSLRYELIHSMTTFGGGGSVEILGRPHRRWASSTVQYSTYRTYCYMYSTAYVYTNLLSFLFCRTKSIKLQQQYNLHFKPFIYLYRHTGLSLSRFLSFLTRTKNLFIHFKLRLISYYLQFVII